MILLNQLQKNKIGELKINDYENQLKKFLLAENSTNKKWSKSAKNYWSKKPKDLNFARCSPAGTCLLFFNNPQTVDC